MILRNHSPKKESKKRKNGEHEANAVAVHAVFRLGSFMHSCKEEKEELY